MKRLQKPLLEQSPTRSPTERTLGHGQFTASPLFPRPSPLKLPGAVEASTELAAAEAGVRDLSSNTQTVFNIINNYVGIVLLSQAFCCRQAGWLSLAALGFLTAFGAFTGDLIVRSYRVIAEDPGVVPSYASIGERCMGAFGKWLVLGSSILETFIACLCMNIIIWQNAALLLPGLELSSVIGICVFLSLPTNWLKDFTLLSFLSAFGLASILLICLAVGYQLAVTAGPEGSPVPPRTAAEPWGLPMASSIMMAGLTGHVGLPPMYCEMKRPADFQKTLYGSFLVMFVAYGYVGVCGYLLYGDNASMLITADMSAAAHDVRSARRLRAPSAVPSWPSWGCAPTTNATSVEAQALPDRMPRPRRSLSPSAWRTLAAGKLGAGADRPCRDHVQAVLLGANVHRCDGRHCAESLPRAPWQGAG